MKAPKASMLLVAVIVALVGCATLPLGQSNATLTQLYRDLQEGDAYAQTTARQGLSALAKEAAAEAGSLSVSDPQNKIAFYRIAVTAAWQAGDYTDVVQYAESGKTLCETTKTDNRDCLMLAVFPDFAAIDETTSAFSQDKKRCTALSPECLSAFRNAFDHYAQAVERLVEIWPKVEVGSADEKFKVEVARRMGETTCMHMKTGILAELQGWSGMNEADVAGMEKRADKLLLLQKTKGIKKAAGAGAFACDAT